MIIRITGSVAVFCMSFALFALFDLFAESLNDGLSKFPVPAALFFVDALAPISWMIVILPIGISVLYWRLRPEQNDWSSIIWHGLIVTGAYLAISAGIAISNHFIYLDGQRNFTLSRIIGNGVLCAIVITGLVSTFRTQRRARQGGALDEGHRARRQNS